LGTGAAPTAAAALAADVAAAAAAAAAAAFVATAARPGFCERNSCCGGEKIRKGG